jgi:hypothetical protein
LSDFVERTLVVPEERGEGGRGDGNALKLLVERNPSAHEEYLAEICRKDERKPSYVRISARFMPSA